MPNSASVSRAQTEQHFRFVPYMLPTGSKHGRGGEGGTQGRDVCSAALELLSWGVSEGLGCSHSPSSPPNPLALYGVLTPMPFPSYSPEIPRAIKWVTGAGPTPAVYLIAFL